MPVRKDSLKGLDSSQVEAASHGEGPLLVLAGPGSGKTRVIACRIAYLLNDLSVPPGNILAVTFTNKAAAEMKERVGGLAGERTSGIWIGTFHSICLRILKIEADFLEGYTRDFVIYDKDDQLSLVKSCMKELDYGEKLFSPQTALSEFDAVENRTGEPFGDDFYGRALSALYDLWKKELLRRNAMTFNDILRLANELLSENEGIRARYQNRFSHVLVDEYQDTNTAQYRFVKTLSERHRNLFVVGDDSQSIYGWRGADINNILNFERDFPGARVVKLERNYRSTSTILHVANSVISKNLRRKEKTLWTANPEGEKAVVFKAFDSADEARFLAERTSRLVESGAFTWGDVAVFYRAHFQSRVVEERLTSERIPYRIVSGVGFYQRAEIKDVVAYLRLIQNPRDDVSFERIVNVPPRKIGEATLRKLRGVSEVGGFSLLEAIEYCQEQNLLSSQQLSALSQFLDIVKELRSAVENRPAAAVIRKLLERTDYLAYLGKDHQRAENVKEFSNAAEGLGDMVLSDFLDLVLLATDEDREDSGAEKVSLMTIHAAKGLEFPAVFVVGMNENLLPHYRSVSTLEGLEEERRLFYVAVTRAESLLYLSYVSQKTASGHTYRERRSVFLDDLPREHVVYESREKEISGRGSDRFPYSSSKPPRGSGGEDRKLRLGQRVAHRIFGPGIVNRIEGKGNKAVVTVDFSGRGVKKILASFLTA